jgi:hypothetical protein
MSIVSAFVDAFKKAIGRKPAVDIEDVRSSGGLGPTHDTGAFDPLRPSPTPDLGSEVDTGDLSVASGDPEEGGEIAPNEPIPEIDDKHLP